MPETETTSLAECAAWCYAQDKQFLHSASDEGECKCSSCPEGTYLDKRLNYCKAGTLLDACKASCSGECTLDGECKQCEYGQIQFQNACVKNTSLDGCIAQIVQAEDTQNTYCTQSGESYIPT